MCKQEWMAEVSRIVELEKRVEEVAGRVGLIPDNELWGRLGAVEEKVEALEKWSRGAGKKVELRVQELLKEMEGRVRQRLDDLEEWKRQREIEE
jgi:tetrahydromethanopterin S-methyltransferase subunit G